MTLPSDGRLKLIELPLITLDGSSIDIGPLLGILILLLMSLGGLFLGRRRQRWRTVTQGLSFILFVWFFHRTMCVLRAWVFGIELIGHNDTIAFLLLHVAVVLGAMALLAGGLFCGWMCPLGALQEFVGRLTSWVRKHMSPTSLSVIDMSLAIATTVVMVSLLWWFAPANFFITEYSSAAFVVTGLLLLPIVIAFPAFDHRLKRFRTFSLMARLVVVLLGIYVTNPGCTLYEIEVDYSSIVTFIGVVLAATVVMRAYCRYICPFGALFGLLGRVALIRIKPHESPCSRSCGRCTSICPTGALNEGVIHGDFCIMCGRCLDRCGSTLELSITPPSSPQGIRRMDPSS